MNRNIYSLDLFLSYIIYLQIVLLTFCVHSNIDIAIYNYFIIESRLISFPFVKLKIYENNFVAFTYLRFKFQSYDVPLFKETLG